MKMNPKIYVACLAAYNAGSLHGKWIDANQDPSEIHSEISKMLKRSPEIGAEEWAVHDYEGFGEISLSEWPDINRVSKIAVLLEAHGYAFSAWYESADGKDIAIEELEERFLGSYQGTAESKEDFADDLLESTGAFQETPKWVRQYFDFKAYARDLELSGDYSFVRKDGLLYVFYSR
jgi:antirestriction protein